MPMNNENPVNLGSIAIVGKSALFPVSVSAQAFWASLLALKGLVSELATGEWPFNKFLSSEDLERIKGFFMKSGIPEGEFEIPPEILKISTVLKVVPLFLAKQALNDCQSFKNGLISDEKVKVMLETNAKDQMPESAQSEIDLLAQDSGNIFANHHGFKASPVGTSSPLSGCLTWITNAVSELQAGISDLVIAGSTDRAHSILGWITGKESDQPAEPRLREGLCMLALRRLVDAKRDNDQILAVITDVDASSIGFSKQNSDIDNDKKTNVEQKNAPTELPDSASRLEHLANFVRLPVSDIVEENGACLNLPFNHFPEDSIVSGSKSSPSFAAILDQKLIRDCLVKQTCSRRFFHDLLGALFSTFVSRVVVQDPKAFAAISSRPVIYLANHQIGLESPLFMALSFGMTGVPIQAVAKPDHIDAWLSFLMVFAKDSLENQQPFRLLYFDKQNPQGLIDGLNTEESCNSSLLVHVEGTRSLSAEQPVAKISSVFLDMAINKKIPIVPVRFIGGLPDKPTEKGLDFPFENGKQDYLIGTPILPESLQKLPYGQRPKFVMEKINTLGPGKNEDVLLPPSPEFRAKTQFFIETFGLPKIQAMLFAILQGIEEPCEETQVLINAVKTGKLSGSGESIPPVLKNFLGHLKTKFA